MQMNLKSVSQLANHRTIAAFEYNMVSMSELVVLLWLTTGDVGAIGYGKLLLRSMSAACKLAVAKDELSPMQGVAILRDNQRGVYLPTLRKQSEQIIHSKRWHQSSRQPPHILLLGIDLQTVIRSNSLDRRCQGQVLGF